MKTRHTRLATVILCLLLWCAGAHAQVLNAEAQKHFNAGLAYVDDPSGSKWEDALKEFRAAYAASPTWKLMNNIGLCALNLERDGEAIEAYRAYLDHGGESDFTAKQRKQMEKDIAMLSASLVRVTLDFQPSEAMLIDERRNAKGAVLVNQYNLSGGRASLGIHPGLHKFTLVAPGYTSADWLFDASPSSTHQHQFKLVPDGKSGAGTVIPPGTSTNSGATPSSTAAGSATTATTTPPVPGSTTSEPPIPTERYTPTGVYVGLVATGVFAAAATVTGVVTMSNAKDFDHESDPAKRHDIASSGKTFSWLTNIGAGAALVSAGVTAYLYFTAPKATSSQSARRMTRISSTCANTSLRLDPVVAPQSAGLAISGIF